MVGNGQGRGRHPTGGPKTQPGEPEPAGLRSAIALAIASLDADLANIEQDKEPHDECFRPNLPVTEPEVLRAQRLARLRELRKVFADIKRRLDRSRS